MHCSHGTHNHFIKKKIKNESHGIIHTFKNYFVTIFLVFSKISCIQMDPVFQKSELRWWGRVREIIKKVKKYYFNKKWCIIDNLKRIFLQINHII